MYINSKTCLTSLEKVVHDSTGMYCIVISLVYILVFCIADDGITVIPLGRNKSLKMER